ncbi:MAG: c-type cytochrome biogenesis protein CcsB [Bacteroidetes bacterium]|nr:c-type cytochrome biogenesis protein CcsB [Bacteroidota bacterium]
MAAGSQYLFGGAFLAVAIAALLYILTIYGKPKGVGRYASLFAGIGFVVLTLSLALRWAASGHAPFANQYEFAVSFAWGTLAAHLYFERRYRLRSLGALVVPVALALLVYAATIPSDIEPLVPALQNALLLTIHVAVAVVAYGTFAAGFGAALLYLLQIRGRIAWLPTQDVLDEVGYRAVIVGFPMMALVIILGAVWADIAWGSYWSWDPKETASLVTWLIYGAYLHARATRGWRGSRAAGLLIIGFGATVFTFFSNLFLSGLHAYGGVQ